LIIISKTKPSKKLASYGDVYSMAVGELELELYYILKILT
jgi:hypothetical protein